MDWQMADRRTDSLATFRCVAGRSTLYPGVFETKILCIRPTVIKVLHLNLGAVFWCRLVGRGLIVSPGIAPEVSQNAGDKRFTNHQNHS